MEWSDRIMPRIGGRRITRCAGAATDLQINDDEKPGGSGNPSLGYSPPADDAGGRTNFITIPTTASAPAINTLHSSHCL